LLWPAAGGISTLHGEGGHLGIDIMGYTGQPVIASAGGLVTSTVRSDSGYGWRVAIDHGDGLMTLYAHLSEFSVSVGERVTAGHRIGSVGSTGLSTGPHLHFEVRQLGGIVDPLDFLR
jgi:murein DD-endopeptidase MepM/ murein hydrolase activator NlpD